MPGSGTGHSESTQQNPSQHVALLQPRTWLCGLGCQQGADGRSSRTSATLLRFQITWKARLGHPGMDKQPRPPHLWSCLGSPRHCFPSLLCSKSQPPYKPGLLSADHALHQLQVPKSPSIARDGQGPHNPPQDLGRSPSGLGGQRPGSCAFCPGPARAGTGSHSGTS